MHSTDPLNRCVTVMYICIVSMKCMYQQTDVHTIKLLTCATFPSSLINNLLPTTYIGPECHEYKAHEHPEIHFGS
jgi:hypothetical protein